MTADLAPVFTEHRSFLWALSYRLTGNAADADDVVQETFLRAYRAIGSFDSRATFTTWIHY